MILFLSNADTDLLALRIVCEGMPEGFDQLRAANPATLQDAPDLADVRLVIVRLLGGKKAWEDPLVELVSSCRQAGIPLVGFGGEVIPDPEMAGLSSIPEGIVAQGFAYLAQGGTENLEHFLRFLSDTILMTGYGFDPPKEIPLDGVFYKSPEIESCTDNSGAHSQYAPLVGVIFYRAHLVSGNTQFVTDLCHALESRGARALALWCYSLRPTGALGLPAAVEILREHQVDSVITTVLAAGSATKDGDGWDASALGSLDVPIVQAVAATSTMESWAGSTAGLSPMDVAMAVAIPEFDGRVISTAFSFKERVDDGGEIGTPVVAYRTVADRVSRVAGIASRLGGLRRKNVKDRRVAIVLSAYPTRRSRLGNAVGLDTPSSVLELLSALDDNGYYLTSLPGTGDELMAALADSLVYESSELSTSELDSALGRLGTDCYMRWFSTLPEDMVKDITGQWGAPPGKVRVDRDGFVVSGVDLGNVVVAIQPPRGYGDDPIALYHSPVLPPTHHYLAFYRWLDEVWGADVVVHMGKHGTVEWLPGKSVGISSSCYPDAALGDVPFVYPFVVNDPGEGTQAKRRGHAIIVDHLVPPLTRAETYDDLARLEALLDTHAQLSSMDPSKLPKVRRQVWDLMVQAEIHRDLGLHSLNEGSLDVEDASFDDLIVEIDGYLCELKDAQIRGGLHILGRPPCGEAELDFVLALTSVPQGRHPSLRSVIAADLGIDPSDNSRASIDMLEAECRRALGELQLNGWQMDAANRSRSPGTGDVLAWICESLVPSIQQSSDEICSLLRALDGRHIASGPSGAPSRGMAHVLPTGRNFYSVDPKAIPSPLAWEVGAALAEGLCDRFLSEEGCYPRHVGLVVWGTAAMRTAGDDIAQALALIGVKPTWTEESGRVSGLRVMDLEELGRPRVDVTLRISGFFRDAFPHVIALLDDAMGLVADLDEPAEVNPLRCSGHDRRIFGPAPGGYGSGILGLIDAGSWRSDQDLAKVYLEWSGFSYGRSLQGEPAAEELRRRLSGVQIAVKNQDNREHDIFDSDDYLQDHGGMVNAIRSLAGSAPKAFFGDSADPSRPKVRSLAEEAARVVRTRVINPKWLDAMKRHGYKGAFEMAATVDYLFGYDATTGVVQDWMYERVTQAYVGDPEMRKFFAQSNPWALQSIAERLLEADQRGLWHASPQALQTLRAAVLEAEAWEEGR
ncbi:MAG: cobaltochelatase subunit CobN [Actinobacteria bacterium]|nr:cobaltochelatase subunit CobN [Actinomycetota bacterium]